MDSIISLLWVPLRALVVALAGVGLAWLYFHDHWPIDLLAVAAGAVVGVILDWVGRCLLPGKPVGASYFLEGWLLIPLALGALAAAAVVIVTVELTLPDGTATNTKELVGGVSSGITTFLTGGFVAWAGDDKDSSLADHIKEQFQKHYARPGEAKSNGHIFVFKKDSQGERWVFADETEGIEGWGRSARRKRAKGIAREMKGTESTPTDSELKAVGAKAPAVQ